MTSSDNRRQVLFLCTGNYNRSRFAELLFNALAGERRLHWRADSRGTDLEGVRHFILGQISEPARQALEAREVDVLQQLRDPIQLTEGDLLDADLIVAVCEAEHRPHIEREYPASARRVEYWNVRDVPVLPADQALVAIEQHVLALVERLASNA